MPPATVPVPIRRLAYRVAHRLLRVYWRFARPQTRGVKCVVREGDAVVFVRHAYGDRRLWELPGGGIRRGEEPRDAAAREAREELGLDLADWRTLGTVKVYGYGRGGHAQLLRGPVTRTVARGRCGGDRRGALVRPGRSAGAVSVDAHAVLTRMLRVAGQMESTI